MIFESKTGCAKVGLHMDTVLDFAEYSHPVEWAGEKWPLMARRSACGSVQLRQTSGLENAQFGAHVRRMAKPTIVTCPSCGVVYERRIEKLSVRDQDSFECTCGHTLERWSSSTFPIFLKIKDAPAKGTV